MALTLPPGNYTAIVEGKNSGTGVALVEIYDVDRTGSKLVNLSTRSVVRTGAEVQIAGFVIAGPDPQRVLIRASGPALATYGVTGTLPDPTLQLYRRDSPIGSNDHWATDEFVAFQKEAIGQKVGAFSWNRSSRDASVIVTLEPGAYSAIVSGAADGTGVALIEVYEVD